MKAKSLMIGALLPCLFASGCRAAQEAAPEAAPVKVVVRKAAPAEAGREFAYSGTIVESESLPQSFAVTGTVTRVLVNEGDFVAKGALLAELDASTYRQALEMAQAGVKQAEDAFNRLSRMYKNGNLPEIKYIEVETGLQKARAEFRLLEAFVRAEGLKTRLKLGEYLSQVGVGVAGMYMKIDEQKGKTNGAVFGTLSIPLSGWWEASHTLSAAKAREEIARNSMKDNAELLLLQMEKAWQDLTDAHKRVELAREARAQADENLRVNQDSYDKSLSPVSDLLEAQALLQQANDQATDATAEFRIKLVNYLQVTGR